RAVGDATKATGVVEAQLVPVVERCAEVRVLGNRGVGITDQQVSGHAEVHHQLVARVQPEQQVFAAAFDALETLTGEQSGKHPAVGDTHDVGAIHGDSLDAPSRHGSAEIAGDRLHLGPLR